jgi:hypothetical protein
MDTAADSQRHIEHYRALLEVEFDPDRRAIVARLLKDAESTERNPGAMKDLARLASADEPVGDRSREERDRLAESPTAAAETFLDRERRAAMSDAEKLQLRIDDQMARTP